MDGNNCTANIEQLVGSNEIDRDQFGKILGRFDTKNISSEPDAAYITKKRILEKNSNGISELRSFYDKNKIRAKPIYF